MSIGENGKFCLFCLFLSLQSCLVVGYEADDLVGGDGESDVLAAEVYGSIDAHDIAYRVQKRSSAVSRADRSARLDHSREDFLAPAVLSSGGNDPVEAADYPLRDRILVFSQGISYSVHSLSDHQIVGVVELEEREVAPVDLDQGHIIIAGA